MRLIKLTTIFTFYFIILKKSFSKNIKLSKMPYLALSPAHCIWKFWSRNPLRLKCLHPQREIWKVNRDLERGWENPLLKLSSLESSNWPIWSNKIPIKSGVLNHSLISWQYLKLRRAVLIIGGSDTVFEMFEVKPADML